MPFEGMPPQTTRRVPRAKMPSPAERPIRDAEKPSKINITPLYRAYGIHEAARQRRLSRLQDAPEVSYALTDEVDLPASEEAWREHDAARAEQIRGRSERIGDVTAQQFRNRMSYRHRYSPTPGVEAELRSRAEAPPLPSYNHDLSETELRENDLVDKAANEFRTRLRDQHDNRLADQTAAEFRTRLENQRNAPELSYGDMVDIDVPGSEGESSSTELDKSDLIDIDPKTNVRGMYDAEIADYVGSFTRDHARKTPPPAPEAARNRVMNENQREVAELLAELKAERIPANIRHEREAAVESPTAQAARRERERQDPATVLSKEMERDMKDMRIRDLQQSKRAIVEYPRVHAQAMSARVESIGNAFQAKTGVSIEAYLAGTASLMDRARITALNFGSALKQPLKLLTGLFSPGRPTENGAPRELSPQAILEQYERARSQAAEAQAMLAGAEVDAQRHQNQIDQLEMTSNAFRAKEDAAYDRAERARNGAVLGRRMGAGGAATLMAGDHAADSSRFESPVRLRLDEDDLEEFPDAPTNNASHHATALRTGHRDRGFNPLTTSPSLRKLAPLYAGPELSRTNAIKGFEEYDNVMDIPGFRERQENLTTRDMDEFLSDQPASINPERAPWSGETGPSFADSLETVAGAVSKDRTSGIAIADRAYELLEEDRNPEKAQRAHERFAQLGQHMKHFDAIQKALASRDEYEDDMREAVKSPGPGNLRYINAHILSAVDQVGRKNDIPAFQEQRAEIAELFSALLRAKAEATVNAEKTEPAQERFEQLGQYTKYLGAFKKEILNLHGGLTETDLQNIVADPKPHISAIFDTYASKAIRNIARRESIASLAGASDGEIQEVATFLKGLLRAKGEAALSTEEDTPDVRLAA